MIEFEKCCRIKSDDEAEDKSENDRLTDDDVERFASEKLEQESSMLRDEFLAMTERVRICEAALEKEQADKARIINEYSEKEKMWKERFRKEQLEKERIEKERIDG